MSLEYLFDPKAVAGILKPYLSLFCPVGPEVFQLSRFWLTHYSLLLGGELQGDEAI